MKKTVKIRVTMDIEVQVSSDWDKDKINFHRNEGSWCANNVIEEITKFTESREECLCPYVTIECLDD